MPDEDPNRPPQNTQSAKCEQQQSLSVVADVPVGESTLLLPPPCSKCGNLSCTCASGEATEGNGNMPTWLPYVLAAGIGIVVIFALALFQCASREPANIERFESVIYDRSSYGYWGGHGISFDYNADLLTPFVKGVDENGVYRTVFRSTETSQNIFALTSVARCAETYTSLEESFQQALRRSEGSSVEHVFVESSHFIILYSTDEESMIHHEKRMQFTHGDNPKHFTHFHTHYPYEQRDIWEPEIERILSTIQIGN